MPQLYDVVIIGAGPAGMSAALYTSRMNLSTLLIDQGLPGGQLLETNEIDNYLGSATTDAFELADLMSEHATKFGAELQSLTDVQHVTKENDLFVVTTEETTYHAKSLILATGTSHKTLDIDKRYDFLNQSISYCAVCDAPFYENEDVIVVGGGDTAFESATLLASYAKSVTIVTRSVPRAKPHLIKAVEKLDNVDIEYGVLTDITKDENLSSVTILHKDQSTSTISASGIFVCIGSKPNYDYIDQSLLSDVTIENDYISSTDLELVDGVFVAGDMIRSNYRQVSIAVADGTIAALKAYDYLLERGD